MNKNKYIRLPFVFVGRWLFSSRKHWENGLQTVTPDEMDMDDYRVLHLRIFNTGITVETGRRCLVVWLVKLI